MKKKKIYICIGTLVVFVLVSFVLLTHTNLTKSWAFATAENKFNEEYSDWGTVVESDVSDVIYEREVFPRYKSRSYQVIFVNENDEAVMMEVSAYLPFIVGKVEDLGNIKAQ